MSRPNRNSSHKIKDSVRQTVPTNDPLIVIYNFNNKNGVKTAVEALLMNNELPNSTSSIFVIVPASDDEDDENLSGSFNSTIGIQLSENYAGWKKNSKSESDMRFKKKMPCNPTPSKHDNKIFEIVFNGINKFHSPKDITNKLCQITTPYEVSNKLCQMSTPCEVTNKLCQVTAPDGDIRRPYYDRMLNYDYRQTNSQDTRFCRNTLITKKFDNKLCQVRIPAEVIYHQSFVAGTDTTIDRPCCCEIVKTAEKAVEKSCCVVNTHFTGPVQKCTKRIITTESQLISPVLVKTDFSTEDFNLSNHSSFLQPSNIPFSSISASLISPETARYETDPLFQLDRRCAYNTPMPELDGNQELSLQSCQCTPEKLRRLLEQVLAEKSLNKISVCCGSPIETYQGPRRTRFLDIKCSPCWPTTAISERMKCGPNPSINCDCNKLSDLTGQTLKNIATSPLLSSDEAVNIGVQDTDLSRHFNLGEHPITIDSFGYQRGTKANGSHSVVKVKGTYTQADKQRKNLPLNPLHQYENISINSNNNDNIKTNLVHTMSDLNFSVHTQPPKPNINVRTNIVEGQMNSGYLRPIEHYDNISMFSKTNDQIMSNLIRALSGFKYSQKQPPCQQYPKPNVTFEEFLKHCATVKKNFIHALPPSGIMKKPIKKPNLNETQKRIGTTPYTLHEAPNKLKEQKVKEDPAQGFKLSISRKSSDFTGHTNSISIT